MNIWYIIFFISIGFFILKTIISFFLGDIDVDFDADGDVDFDLSSMFSFKGALHFLMGFSTYLSLVAKLDTSYSGYGVYNYSIWSYLIAFVVGLIFTYLLFQLYRLMMKLNHYSDNISFNECKCSILSYDKDNNVYTALIYTPSGTFKKEVIPDTDVDLKIGEEYTVKENENKLYVY